jgi:TolB-like protein/DNA-binding winged helix-turn-helix (wHTH) protein
LLYLFEDYALDTDRRELHRRGAQIALAPQVFDILEYLIRNRERVVSKESLIATVWGGRIVSESALTTRINAVRYAIGDSGDEQRLIKTLLRKGIRFVGTVREQPGPAGADAIAATALAAGPSPTLPGPMDLTAERPRALAIPEKPSIVVLPFANLSAGLEQEYFADGVVEEIITALSRFSGLFVIARNSSFTYRGRAVDVRSVGRELGVRYVLEGSVRRDGQRVRITGQLINAAIATHLWADRFDGDLQDIFGLQDRVTASVVGAIAPKIEQAEIERTRLKPTESLDAYDYYLRGRSSFHQWTQDAASEALRLFYKALEADPDFASAYGMAAMCYAQRRMNSRMPDRRQEIAEAARLATRAAALGKNDAVALSSAGYAQARVVGDLDAGVALLDRALVLNPNLAQAWYCAGYVKIFCGEPDMALEHLEHVMRLSPIDPLMFLVQTGTAFAHLIAGRYDEASSWADQALREKPDYHPALRVAAASNALAGRLSRARNALAHLRELNPVLRVSSLKDLVPFRRPEDLARYEEGLRKAGLPE